MRRPLAVLAINIALFCALAEVVGLVVYYYQHGWFFYTAARPAYERLSEVERQSLTREGLHPYFGPTHASGIPFDIPDALRSHPSGTPARRETNNFGFVSPYAYPVSRTSDRQFIIGLFGGSVGLWFCEVGAEHLFENLRRHGFFQHREIIPVCLSHEGYKQPQQLLVLSYFLSIGQPFDAVINIDGFNEVALGRLNNDRGLDISMPSVMHLDPLINLVNQATLTPAKLETLARINRDKAQLNRLAGRINRARLASVDVVLEAYYGVVDGRYRRALVAFDTLPSASAESSLVEATGSVRTRTGTALVGDMAASWARSSILMHRMLAAGGVPYFHVLQPNQYSTSRVFGAAEAKVALNEQSPFRAGVVEGYPVLTSDAEATRLRTGGVRFFNATRIFDTEPSQVYMDDCCHYTLKGNYLLADFIASSILGSPGPWKN